MITDVIIGFDAARRSRGLVLIRIILAISTTTLYLRLFRKLERRDDKEGEHIIWVKEDKQLPKCIAIYSHLLTFRNCLLLQRIAGQHHSLATPPP